MVLGVELRISGTQGLKLADRTTTSAIFAYSFVFHKFSTCICPGWPHSAGDHPVSSAAGITGVNHHTVPFQTFQICAMDTWC
jgi:hypothetical protein